MNTACVHTKSNKNNSELPLRVNPMPPGSKRAYDGWYQMSIELGYIEHVAEPEKEIDPDKLKAVLNECGFYNLPKVKDIKHKDKLLKLLSSDERCLPYKVAMLGYLELFENVSPECTLERLYKKLAEPFNTTLRRIKGNRLVLNINSSEDRKVYKAHEYIKQANSDYDKVKLGHAP